MDIKSILINEISNIKDISDNFKETITISLIDETEEVKEQQSNNATVNRETIIDYLVKSGLPLNDETYANAEKMFLSSDARDTKRILMESEGKKTTETKVIDHLHDLSHEELMTLLSIGILKSINKNKTPIRYEYKVEIIRDKLGSTDISYMSELLENYGKNGYKVVSVHTNELGKNAVSVGNFGVNSTADETIIIFEKAIYD